MDSTQTNSSKENYSFKNNLIQNFYIIGLSLNDFFQIDEEQNKLSFINIFDKNEFQKHNLKPKIITKFPNDNSCINKIPDNIIIDHCFPNGKFEYDIQNGTYEKTEFFQFELDNIPQNYYDEDNKLYSKIYFSCLQIKEHLNNYYIYRDKIIKLLIEKEYFSISDSDKNFEISIEEQPNLYYVSFPKVICFASVLPFYNEFKFLLENIYDYSLSGANHSLLPLEKIIEKIVTETPIPIKSKQELIINFDTKAFHRKIIFPQFNINEMNINYSSNLSLFRIFQIFNIEEIINIFRLILYEFPILIFSDDSSILSIFTDIFLTLLSPFKYIFPHVSILPKKLYGLINSEKIFIFGIKENYRESFFIENKIALDKDIIIVSINSKENKGSMKLKIFDENNYDTINIKSSYLSRQAYKIVTLNGQNVNTLSVDIPSIFKKNLLSEIKKYLSKNKEPQNDFTYKIQKIFYRFFVNVLQGFNEYLNRSDDLYDEKNKFSKNKNIGDNLFVRADENFVIKVFDKNNFSTDKDCVCFYKILFKTEMFKYFLREKIYKNDIMNQLSIKQFEQLTVLKKYSQLIKKKENKIFFENFLKDIQEPIKYEEKKEIIIKEEEKFNMNGLQNYFKDERNNFELLLQYGQYFLYKKDGISIDYFFFPKLIFEYLYRENDVHPKPLEEKYLIDFKNLCKQEKENLVNIRPYAFYNNFFHKLPKKNLPCRNYKIHSQNYIFYIWFLLLSSSLWYCEQEEKNFRLDKMFSILNNFEFIEEYVLDFLFINIYKSSDVFHMIKIFVLYYKIVGHVNYFLLNLVGDKVLTNKEDNNNTESENDSLSDDEDNDNKIKKKKELIFSKRYLINTKDIFSLNNEIKKEENNDNLNNNNVNNVDELIFCSEQKCPKCNILTDINAKKIAAEHIDLNIDCYQYQCRNCKQNNDIIIKYQIKKYNYKMREIFLIENGHFKFLTQYKLYQEVKSYFIKENKTSLDIDKIFDLRNNFNLFIIIFYFSLLKLPFDFLFPYESQMKENIPGNVDNIQININNENNNYYRNRFEKPIEFNFDSNQIKIRRFNNIQPKLNILKKNNKYFGIFKGKDKYKETDLSFTIKNKKKKNI